MFFFEKETMEGNKLYNFLIVAYAVLSISFLIYLNVYVKLYIGNIPIDRSGPAMCYKSKDDNVNNNISVLLFPDLILKGPVFRDSEWYWNYLMDMSYESLTDMIVHKIVFVQIVTMDFVMWHSVLVGQLVVFPAIIGTTVFYSGALIITITHTVILGIWKNIIRRRIM